VEVASKLSAAHPEEFTTAPEGPACRLLLTLESLTLLSLKVPPIFLSFSLNKKAFLVGKWEVLLRRGGYNPLLILFF